MAHGIYYLTHFVDWRPAGGSLLPLPVIDGIGVGKETTSGILTVWVTLVPVTGPTASALLKVHCALPGAKFPIEEGVSLEVGPFHFMQDGGLTLFPS